LTKTRSVLLSRAKALGFELQKAIPKAARLRYSKLIPPNFLPVNSAVRILDGVKAGANSSQLTVSTCYLNAMPGEKYLNNQLHELCSYLNQQGILTILILAQHGLATAAEAPVDLSYLCGPVISLRYFEAYGVVKQAIA